MTDKNAAPPVVAPDPWPPATHRRMLDLDEDDAIAARGALVLFLEDPALRLRSRS